MSPVADTTTTAGLLAYVKLLTRRPDADAEMDDDDWYTLLTEAQKHWYTVFCQHFPEVLMGAPQKMSTSDNKVFTFPSGVFPFGAVEIRSSPGGYLLTPGPEWDDNADYTPEGDQIRLPSNRSRSFSDGPYARFVEMPGNIDGSTEPTLKPASTRDLIAMKAASMFASRGGGQRNPAFYDDLVAKRWEGDARIAGDTGVMGLLKTQFFGRGLAAQPSEKMNWFRPIDWTG